MYECRCPHDGKKLAEIARPPLALGHYDYPCECGRWVRGQIITEPGTNSILATVIEGKSLKGIFDPRHYEKLKKRRQRTIRAIETHLANKLKL